MNKLEERVEQLEGDMDRMYSRTGWFIFWIIVLFLGVAN